MNDTNIESVVNLIWNTEKWLYKIVPYVGVNGTYSIVDKKTVGGIVTDGVVTAAIRQLKIKLNEEERTEVKCKLGERISATWGAL